MGIGTLIELTSSQHKMEKIKRQLYKIYRHLNGHQTIVISTDQKLNDFNSQMRIHGILNLLKASNRSVVFRSFVRRSETLIWLGDRPPTFSPQINDEHWLLWPRPDISDSSFRELTNSANGSALVCFSNHAQLPLINKTDVKSILLPDPMHALFGLLDQHPLGQGCLRVTGDKGWEELLLPSRIALLARIEAAQAIGLSLHFTANLVRCRLIERARRVVVAHAKVQSDRIGPGLLAALLGRRFFVVGENKSNISAYWETWNN